MFFNLLLALVVPYILLYQRNLHNRSALRGLHDEISKSLNAAVSRAATAAETALHTAVNVGQIIYNFNTCFGNLVCLTF